MDFAQLKVDKKIIEILNNKRYTVPTEIQAKTYSLAANGHDVVGVSQTGSGKTLAFLLPTLNQFILSDKSFHTLIITPTRELALQIGECLSDFISLGVRYTTLVGGEPFTPQVDSINKHPHIIIGTPGRIAKHINKTKNFKIGLIRKLVLDEADRFFEQDFTEDVDLIAARLTHKNQTLMFTATLTEKVKQLSKIFMNAPRIIGNLEKYEGVGTLKEFCSFIPDKYKLTVLCNYLSMDNSGSTIVFVGMCVTAQKITAFLKKFNCECECLYGGITQNKREEIIQQFKSKEFNILISTDLASRGLDISHVESVINYDLPKTAKDYIHRVGRTARAGNEGTAISFVTQYDVAQFQKLEFVLKRKLESKSLKLYQGHKEFTEVFEEINTELNKKNIGRKKKQKI